MVNEKVKFTITVKDNEYTVTPLLIGDETSQNNHYKERFRIETGCDYLFTIEMKEEWFWEIVDNKIKAIDKELVQNIGQAIERTN
jgi:hypothetical protein